MSRKIKFFQFEDGQTYTVANEIEAFAHSLGAPISRDAEGNKHPGTVCNASLRKFLRTSATRRAFSLKASDYSRVDASTGVGLLFVDNLVKQKIITRSMVKSGMLDVYSCRAAQLICCDLLDAPKFKITLDSIDMISIHFNVSIVSKALDFKDLREVPSLLSLGVRKLDSPTCSFSVMDMLSEEEKKAVRKYRSLVIETRENGRKIRKKRTEEK